MLQGYVPRVAAPTQAEVWPTQACWHARDLLGHAATSIQLNVTPTSAANRTIQIAGL